MDALDLKDQLNAVSRGIACLSGLLANQRQVPVTGAELAALLILLQEAIDALYAAPYCGAGQAIN